MWRMSKLFHDPLLLANVSKSRSFWICMQAIWKATFPLLAKCDLLDDGRPVTYPCFFFFPPLEPFIHLEISARSVEIEILHRIKKKFNMSAWNIIWFDVNHQEMHTKLQLSPAARAQVLITPHFWQCEYAKVFLFVFGDQAMEGGF